MTEDIGSVLRATRNDAGISQRDLARRMGVSYVHVCNVENGKSDCSINWLMRVAKALGKELIIRMV